MPYEEVTNGIFSAVAGSKHVNDVSTDGVINHVLLIEAGVSLPASDDSA